MRPKFNRLPEGPDSPSYDTSEPESFEIQKESELTEETTQNRKSPIILTIGIVIFVVVAYLSVRSILFSHESVKQPLPPPLLEPPLAPVIPPKFTPNPGYEPGYKPKTREFRSLLEISCGDCEMSLDNIQTCKPREPRSYLLAKLGIFEGKTIDTAEMLPHFWAIEPVYAYNQTRYTALYERHENFRSYLEAIGVQVATLEGILKGSNQTYIATKPGNEPYDIQITYKDYIYLRENMLNVAIEKLKDVEWHWVTWIDGHQLFANEYWWHETIIRAEKYGILQIYQRTDRLWWGNESTAVENRRRSVAYQSLFAEHVGALGLCEIGNAYAQSREMYRAMGHIPDECVFTCCDCIFIFSFLPKFEQFPHDAVNYVYWKEFEPWLKRAQDAFKYRRGFVRGELYHFSHSGMPYYDKFQNVVHEMGFNITEDLGRDENGTIFFQNEEMRARINNILENIEFWNQ